jgi:hypothetical protein
LLTELGERTARHALRPGVSHPAGALGATRKTVPKWLRRKEAGKPLSGRSRSPAGCPTRASAEAEQRVAEAGGTPAVAPHCLRRWPLRAEGVGLMPLEGAQHSGLRTTIDLPPGLPYDGLTLAGRKVRRGV